MSQRIPKALKQLVRERAVWRCEYCGVHEDDSVLTHRPDHIVARKRLTSESVIFLLPVSIVLPSTNLYMKFVH